MKNKYTKEQVESAEVTLDQFLEAFGPVKTVQYIQESKRYKELFLELLYRKYSMTCIYNMYSIYNKSI